MSREIKFRGKRIDTGEWVYGYLADENYINDINTVDLSSVEVDPDTVGQYTGLKDWNGREIYEGDFLKSGDVIFEIWWSDDNSCYMLDMVNPFKEMAIRMSDMNMTNMEVIGNRWDNPEMLEDGK